MTAIRSIKALEAELAELARVDPAMARLWRRAGTPALRKRRPGFETLLRVIVGQQLSVQAAATIWRRLEAVCGPLTATSLRGASERDLRGAGLSRAKTVYARALADAVADGAVDFRRLNRLDDEAAIDALTGLKGIGRWSAECYLLFAHGRPDVFPAADLALAASYQKWQRLADRPGEPQLRDIAASWQPHRSAAARLLWHAYRGDVL